MLQLKEKLINLLPQLKMEAMLLLSAKTIVRICLIVMILHLAEILENTFDNNITVYPNPTDGILIVNLGETVSEFAISITDVSGKLLKQSTYKNTQKFELNLDVKPGFYLLTIQSKNKKAIIRLIKN